MAAVSFPMLWPCQAVQALVEVSGAAGNKQGELNANSANFGQKARPNYVIAYCNYLHHEEHLLFTL